MAEAGRPAKNPKLDREEEGGGDNNPKVDGEKEYGTNHREADEQAQAALEKIVSIQHEIDKLNEQASEEILHVEQKYNHLRKPHYLNRAQLAEQIPEFWYTTVS